MSHVRICGVKIDNVTMEEAVARAWTSIGEPCVVFTPNALMLEACRHNTIYQNLLNRSSLAIPDGYGVLRAAKKAGQPMKERVAGIAFGEALLARAATEGARVFLLGGQTGVADRASNRLKKRYPNLCICGTAGGYFDRAGEDNQTILSTIRTAKTDILFVCFGFPLQETWICENLAYLSDVRILAGLGGSLDVWAGDVHRAPKIVSQMGLEWAWRMLTEPRRLKGLGAILRFALQPPQQTSKNPVSDTRPHVRT